MNQDYEYFKERCITELNIEEYYQILHQMPKVVEFNPSNNDPSNEWYVHFRKVVRGEFEVSYKTNIKISKIASLFYIQHEFEVANKDEGRMSPVLDGFSNEPYCKMQFDFHENVVKCLENAGYSGLSYAEINEVICNIEMPTGRRIFGTQMTVETALFRDVFELTRNV